MAIPKIINPKHYKKFFTAHAEITCLHSEFLLEGSLSRSDLFLTNKDGIFNIYLNKNKEIKCLEYGLELYRTPKKYNKYFKEFENYIHFANKKIIPKYNKVPKQMTKQEFLKVAVFMSKHWHYYGFTEFPYLDLACQYSQKSKNKTITRNLKEISHYRFAAREVMNAFWFKHGVIQNILAYVSRKYLTNDDAKYLFLDELVKIFDDIKPDKTIINQRKICYSAATINGKIIKFPYKQALELNKVFTQVDKKNIINGIAANPGYAKGRVIIAPMFNDHKVIKRINQIMKKGDILVAETTSPDIMILCRKARAIIADQGGLLSHAAVVSRELGIPCIIQTETATRILKNGDLVEIDANKGIVKKL